MDYVSLASNQCSMLSLVKTHDQDVILGMLELVLGVAVMCEDKAKFIRNIFLLGHHSQSVLKSLVEQVLGRAEDLDVADEDEDETVAPYDG